MDGDPQDRRLDGGEAAHGGREEPGAERAHHGHREHREADLTGERAHREDEPRHVGAAPPLHGEGPGGDEQGAGQHGPLRGTPFQEGHKEGHDNRRASYEDTRYGRFRRSFRSQNRHVETDHPHGREKREAAPLAGAQASQRPRAARAQQGDEKQTREAVADELASQVWVVAQHTVGGEGAADEETGEGRGQRSSRGVHVHASTLGSPAVPFEVHFRGCFGDHFARPVTRTLAPTGTRVPHRTTAHPHERSPARPFISPPVRPRNKKTEEVHGADITATE